MRAKSRSARGKLRTRSLELNVTTHCNLKCYGCGRGSPAFDEAYVDLAELAVDLARLSEVLHTREFKLAGGEPLQHPDILEIIDIVRESGISTDITLITNGVLLHQAPRSLWEKIDQMWVSVYPGVERKLTEEEVLSMGRTWNVQVRYKVTGSFDRRMLNAENTDSALVRDIYKTCYQTRGCHSLYNGRYFKCASGPLIPKWLETAGAEGADFSADGVGLRDNPQLRRDLESYLASPEPLAACSYCLGGVGTSAPHHQLNADGIRDWLAEDHSSLDGLIDMERLATERDPNRGLSTLLTQVSSGLFGAPTPGGENSDTAPGSPDDNA